jgi:hypothetical protein
MAGSSDDGNKLAFYINGGKFDYLSAFILSRSLLHGYLIVILHHNVLYMQNHLCPSFQVCIN